MNEPIYVSEYGGEVHFATDREPGQFDRIELYPDGWVVLINKNSYSKDILQKEAIEGIYTHTSDEEESAEWW
jgi:hypothetical protein